MPTCWAGESSVEKSSVFIDQKSKPNVCRFNLAFLGRHFPMFDGQIPNLYMSTHIFHHIWGSEYLKGEARQLQVGLKYIFTLVSYIGPIKRSRRPNSVHQISRKNHFHK